MRGALAALAVTAALAAPAAARPRLEGPPSQRAVLSWARGLHLHGWRYLGFNDREALFVTEPSNRFDPPRLRFWLRAERFGPGGEARSHKRLIEADCDSFRFRLIEAHAYADNDLKGEVAAAARTAPWQDAADPDVEHAIAFACMARG